MEGVKIPQTPNHVEAVNRHGVPPTTRRLPPTISLENRSGRGRRLPALVGSVLHGIPKREKDNDVFATPRIREDRQRIHLLSTKAEGQENEAPAVAHARLLEQFGLNKNIWISFSFTW